MGWKYLFAAFLFLTACCPQSTEYFEFYQHLHQRHANFYPMVESDYFLIILVDAKHLDYTDNASFLSTVAKHPSDGSKNGEVGHTWIYLQGWHQGKKVKIEGGHSGERGVCQAKYFDGIMNYNDWGYASPTPGEQCHPRFEPNPIKYLWAIQKDGFFQKGSGGHSPTFAAKINLTEQQFKEMASFIQKGYSYRNYSLTQNQCSSFVSQLAGLADFCVESEVSLVLQDRIYFRGRNVRFWQDPYYSIITFASPDIIEKSLMQAVREGRAEDALGWYQKQSR